MKRAFLAAAVAFALVTVNGSTVFGQVYTRPSAGNPVTVISTTTLSGSTDVTSQVYGWSGFSGALIILTTDHTGCQYHPLIKSEISSASGGSFVIGNTPNSQYSFPVGGFGESYYVRLNGAFIKFNMTTTDAGSGSACTASVVVIPIPFDLQDNPSTVTPKSRTIATIGATATNVAANSLLGQRNIIVQNQDTVAIKCGLSNAVAPIAGYSIILSAGAVAGDGTGGSVTLQDYAGEVWCITADGSSNKTIGVTQW